VSSTVVQESPGGAVELFTIPFASAMSDDDVSSLIRAADFPARVSTTKAPREERVGPARLDYQSGLFLMAGPDEGRWALQARTWGHPGPHSVHRWKVMAAGAARQLDPSVPLPERWPDASPAVSATHVGSVSNKRLASFRRRLYGGAS
jgi:hypothetical protein